MNAPRKTSKVARDGKGKSPKSGAQAFLGAKGTSLPVARKPTPKSASSLVHHHGSAVILSVLAALSATYVLVFDQESSSTDEIARRKGLLISPWRPGEIASVEVSGPTSFVLTRSVSATGGQPWQLSMGGMELAAEEQTVDHLLSIIEYARVVREVPGGSVDRATMGLVDGLTFKFKMGKRTVFLRLGAKTPNEEGVYAETDQGIFVISEKTAEDLNISPERLRSRTLVPYLSTELKSFSLTGEGGARVFDKAPWGGGRGSGFRFGQGSDAYVGERVSGGRLDQVLVALGTMQADTFLPAERAAELGRSRVVIKMVPNDGPPGELHVGGECPMNDGLAGVVVRRVSPSDLAACVPSRVLAPLLRTAEEFRDDQLIGAAVDEITDVRIASGGQVVEFARLGSGFRVRAPSDADISGELGNQILRGWIDLRGERAPADWKPSGDPVILRVQSQGGVRVDAVRVEELSIYPLGEDRVAVRSEDGTALVVTGEATSLLQPNPMILKDLAIFSFAPNELKSVSWVSPSWDQKLVRTDSGFGFERPSDPGLVPDDTLTTELVSVLSRLRADRWVSAERQPSMGLAEPAIVVELVKDDGTFRLLLGARTEEGVYGAVEGPGAPEGVFLLDGSVRALLGRSLVSRSAFAPKMEDWETVSIVDSKGLVTELTRKGRTWLIGGDRLLGARAARLSDALGDLVPFGASSIGKARPEEGLADPAYRIRFRSRDGAHGAVAENFELLIGAADVMDGTPIRFARRSDQGATFALPSTVVDRLKAAL